MVRQFQFVRGHYYLAQDDLNSIQKEIDINDKEVQNEYHQAFATLIGTGQGLSYGACRMAFYELLKCWDIGEGDEVLLLAFTCAVISNAVLRAGATPIYVDLDRNTLGMDILDISEPASYALKLVREEFSDNLYEGYIPGCIPEGKKV